MLPFRGVNVEYAGQVQGLVGDDPDGLPVEAGQRAHDVASPAFVYLQDVGVVDYLFDDLQHVVGMATVGGDEFGQAGIVPFGRVSAEAGWGRALVVRRKERDEPTDFRQAAFLVIVHETGKSRDGTVHIGPAEVVGCDVFSGDGLDHVRASEKHLPDVPHHEDDVGQGGRVSSASRTGPEYHTDLGNNAGAAHIAPEDFPVTA